MQFRSLTNPALLACVIVSCATAKERLGISYHAPMPGEESAGALYFLKSEDQMKPNTIYCNPSSTGSWTYGLPQPPTAVTCRAFVEADVAEILSIVSNPYLSHAVDSPFFPSVFADSAVSEAHGTQFRYRAGADASNGSAWDLFDRAAYHPSYRGEFQYYTGTGVILIEKASVEWDIGQFGSHTQIDGKYIGGTYCRSVEFKVEDTRIGDRVGSHLFVSLKLEPSSSASGMYTSWANAHRLRSAMLSHSLQTTHALVEAVAAIARLTSGKDIPELSADERAELLPAEFIKWEERK